VWNIGHEITLRISTGGLLYNQALIGFQLSVLQVVLCSLQLPASREPIEISVDMTICLAKSSDWSEDTISAENAPGQGDPFGNAQNTASTNSEPVDVTPACNQAQNGQFSIYVGTNFGGLVFPSKDSGNPEILTVRLRRCSFF